MKSFYISTRKDRSPEADALVGALQARGWKRTFDWGEHGNVGTDQYATIALAEIEGVRDADVLIVLLPGGFGTHVEIGVALALGKRVILQAPDPETLNTPYACVFHYHPNVKRLISKCLSVDDVLTCLAS